MQPFTISTREGLEVKIYPPCTDETKYHTGNHHFPDSARRSLEIELGLITIEEIHRKIDNGDIDPLDDRSGPHRRFLKFSA